MEPSGSTPNDSTVGKADARVAELRALLPFMHIKLVLVRAPQTKKERRQWIRALKSFRVTLNVAEGVVVDMLAYDLYLSSLLYWSDTIGGISTPMV